MRRLALLFALLASPSLASAQAPRDPTRLFPHEASVTTPSRTGLTRLPLTPEVLERAQGDVSDVRLYDADDREVPFLVDSGARRDPDVRRYALSQLDLQRHVEETTRFGPRYVERVVVRVPPDAGHRYLQLGTGRWSYVRHATVHELESGREIFRGSLFSLPNPRRERTRVPLPALGDGSVDLVIELSGEEGYVEPNVDVVVSREPLTPPTLSVALEEVRRHQRAGVTTIEVTRPSGVVPDRVRIVTSTQAFSRQVRVIDVDQGRVNGRVGEGVVWRLDELDGASEADIALGPTRGATLRIEIDDLDSPPLDDLRLEAEVRQPGLLFYSDGRGLTLRFGGGRARAPRYDLADLSGRVIDLVHAVALSEAELGPIRPSARFDDGPALRFAMSPGRPIETGGFSHVAGLEVEGAREGLSRVQLPLSLLAAARADRGDVRIIDASGRQRPYLWGADEDRAVPVELGAAQTSAQSSTYVVELTADRVQLRALAFQTPAEYVARSFVLRGIDASGRWVELARGSLRREPPEVEPLVVSFAPTRVSALELEIVDGDDAPLALDHGVLTAVAPSAFLAAADGRYRVLAGDPELTSPTYEIERARELVLAVRAAEAWADEAEANPAHVEPPWYEGASWSTWGVWAVLLLAMLILGGLTYRVSRHAEPDPDDPEPGASADEPPAAEPEPSSEGDDPETKPIAF